MTFMSKRQKFITCSPSETLHLDAANSLLKLLHVSLVIPRFHIKQDRRFATYKIRLLGA
jgi:hypothetical protein